MVTLIMEIGVLSDKYTDGCQVGMLKLAHDLLQDKLAIMNVPPTLVPHLATVISRFYRETSQDEHQQLRRSIMNAIIKLAHVDVHAPIEQAVAVATLMPLLADRLSDGADDQLFRCEDASVWGALSQGAFFNVLEEFDIPQRARLVRFSKRALNAS